MADLSVLCITETSLKAEDRHVSSVSRCPSARWRGMKKGAAVCPASLCCSPLHDAAHQLGSLPVISLVLWGALCQQCHTDTVTAISRSAASMFCGARTLQTEVKGLGYQHLILRKGEETPVMLVLLNCSFQILFMCLFFVFMQFIAYL